MATDRRSFLHAAAASWLAGIPLSHAAASIGKSYYVSAYTARAADHRLGCFDDHGDLVWHLPLSARGHSVSIHPHRPVLVCFARRPGRFGLIVDLDKKQSHSDLEIPARRHFFGHGVFSLDGKFLYASENDFDNQRGVIGIYSVDDQFSRIGEFDSYGIGPHDIRILSDNKTLVIANGGILTHPAYPRTKLNLPTMVPSLCYVDRESGKLLRRIRLAPSLHQLSIRHLAINQDDVVVAVSQYEGYSGDLVPLVTVQDPSMSDIQLNPLPTPTKTLRAMKQYCGSVCFDSAGRTIAVSAPRGNMVACWNIATNRFITGFKIADCSALAPTDTVGEFVAAAGNGDISLINAHQGTISALNHSARGQRRWDNHMTFAGAER